ncbi:MAG: universal stress protein [Actinomycetota bacterium]
MSEQAGGRPEGGGQGAAEEQRPSEADAFLRRGLGVPWLFAAVYSAVGFSIYFALGVVAEHGLGLTPLIFLASGLLFVLTTLSYVEGGAMFRERGGSSTFSRYAFNELVSFIAGWAILIDYLIVIALAAISIPHYLSPVSDSFTDPGFEVVLAGAVIAAACVLNILDLSGRRQQAMLAGFALADVLLQVAVIVVGAVVVMHPDRLTDQLDLFTSPGFEDIAYAAVLAMLAYAGIEAASNLAPDVDLSAKDLKRVVGVGAVTVPLVYAGMAAIALMAVPVVAGPNGPETELGGRFVEEPVLGVVSAFDPPWLADLMRWMVALIAAPVLFWAANTSMLGVSRHIYTLAINRQIPSWLGKLGTVHQTPHVAIVVSGVIALGLVFPTDVELLAGIYAFGAMLAITIAHVSIVRLRITDPERERPFRIGGSVPWRGAELPWPAMLAAVLSTAAFASVLAFHGGARWVGGGWMAFGLVGYVIYRKLVEGTSLTSRVSVTPEALTKQAPDVEYGRILVPVFGTELDDDIVGTAGRLAAAEDEGGDGKKENPRLDIVYVAEVPMKLPLDAKLPAEEQERAQRALERAREVAEEYESVEVSTELVPARAIGAGIVEMARRANAEAIVMGGEPPSKVRGGAVLGGTGLSRPDEVGAATEYVLKKAPCRVLLTAPPEAEEEEPEESAAGDGSAAGRSDGKL